MEKKYEGHRERLREKYLQGGYFAFHEYEVLELLLTYVIPRKDTKPIAKDLIEKFGSLDGVVTASIEELCSISGIKENSAIFVKLLGDLSKNLYKGEIKKEGIQLKDKNSLIRYLRSEIGFSSREEFRVIFLNNYNMLVGSETLFIGTIDKSAVYPREIVEKVLYYKAKGIIFAHNHPSGNLRPSKQDIQITEHMQEALDLIDVKLLEHIIITQDGYFSFLEEGLI
ncbi:RadC family protein [Fusobacterium mortiferum]|uniref:DNA repair protein RadC n=1 Tax=Fusobacterium mortiferum TaxID=850 RepID=A0ABS2G2N2_FUSMR|nr:MULTISPECIES: DNA repair protein RadC [Fusobacterium]MBM6875671.1 DNA repair protein RadC [Fusobacterium mortiferum]MDO5787939.1 DNA repair protein RadC [Fusobacterium sp.]